jgi:hypothetical protein
MTSADSIFGLSLTLFDSWLVIHDWLLLVRCFA